MSAYQTFRLAGSLLFDFGWHKLKRSPCTMTTHRDGTSGADDCATQAAAFQPKCLDAAFTLRMADERGGADETYQVARIVRIWVLDAGNPSGSGRFEWSDNWRAVPVWRQPWPCEIDCRYLMQLGTGASDRALDNRHSSMQRRHIFLADDQLDLEPLRSSLISR